MNTAGLGSHSFISHSSSHASSRGGELVSSGRLSVLLKGGYGVSEWWFNAVSATGDWASTAYTVYAVSDESGLKKTTGAMAAALPLHAPP